MNSAEEPIQPTGPEATLTNRQLFQRLLSFSHNTIKDVWFYVSMCLLIVNAAYTYQPHIAVAVSGSKTNLLGSLFKLENTGYWTLYDVRMRCDIWDGKTPRASLVARDPSDGTGDAPRRNSTISKLPRNATATRDCLGEQVLGVGPLRPEYLRVDIVITYKWGFSLFTGQMSQRFNTRLDLDSYVLVPDVE